MNRVFFLLELLVVVLIIFLVSRLSYSADVTVGTAITSSDDEIKITTDGKNKAD